MDEAALNEFEGLIDVRFADLDLLRRALTHRSFTNEIEAEIRDNERLEFLGDAILDYVVADMLFRRFPDVSEGELTQLRAALVRTDSLAELANDIQLGEYLIIGKGEANSGGRERANNLCRGFEAIVGAIYMDQGIAAVKRFMLPKLERYLAYVLEHDLHKDARSMLQERSQAELRFTPVYRLVDAAGPEHEKEFVIEVVVGEVVIGDGSGTSKRAAAQSAARTALKRLEDDGWPPEAEDVLEAQLAQEAQQAALEELSAEEKLQVSGDVGALLTTGSVLKNKPKPDKPKRESPSRRRRRRRRKQQRMQKRERESAD